MTRYIKIRPNTRKKTVLTSLLATLILIFIYTGIFHLHSYNSLIYIPPILTMGILCLSYLISIWVEPQIKFFWLFSTLFKWGVAWTSIVAVQQLQKMYYTRQLSQGSEVVYGLVEYTGNKLTPFDDFGQIVVKYEFNNQTWRKKLENPQGSLHVDDLMKIKLATKDPEIIEVLKVYKK